MEFRASTAADMEFVGQHSISRGCFKDQPNVIDYAYTLADGDTVLAMGGFKLMTPSVAWAWLDLTEFARGNIIVTYRVVKEWMERWMKDMKIRRVMAAVECDFGEAIRTVEHLGFRRECTMPDWNGDTPAFLYAKLGGVE